jgi:hypothetical protein
MVELTIVLGAVEGDHHHLSRALEASRQLGGRRRAAGDERHHPIERMRVGSNDVDGQHAVALLEVWQRERRQFGGGGSQRRIAHGDDPCGGVVSALDQRRAKCRGGDRDHLDDQRQQAVELVTGNDRCQHPLDLGRGGALHARTAPDYSPF